MLPVPTQTTGYAVLSGDPLPHQASLRACHSRGTRGVPPRPIVRTKAPRFLPQAAYPVNEISDSCLDNQPNAVTLSPMPVKFGEYPVPPHQPDVADEDVAVTAALHIPPVAADEDSIFERSLLIDARLGGLSLGLPASNPHAASVAGRYGNSEVAYVLAAAGVTAERQPQLTEAGRIAVNGLYAAYHDRILRFLTRCTSGDVPTAEDLTQDTFERATRAIANDPTLRAGFASERAETKWMFQIARRLYIDTYRRRQSLERKGSGISSLDVLLELAGDHFAEPGSPEGGVVNRAVLTQALRQLSAPYRTALLLYELQGYSCDEIAELVGCTPSAIKMRLMRARDRFAVAYAEACADSAVAGRRQPPDRRAVYVTETPGYGTPSSQSA